MADRQDDYDTVKRNYPLTLALAILLLAAPAAAQRQTENVILITLDGARTEEVFGGIDVDLYPRIYKDAAQRPMFKAYSAASPVQRREKLMPFFWRLMRERGSIAGNRQRGSRAETTNDLLFSYPGYSEIVTGRARDDVIRSNDRVQNRFPSFLQFLQRKMKLGKNGVAVFASWNVFNEIVTTDPDAFLVNAGYESYESTDREIKLLNTVQTEAPTPWDSVRHDYHTFRFALEHLRKYRPRVLHIGFGETDDWAHDKNYDRMIDALHRTDSYLRELFAFIDSDPQFRGKTTVLITVDHGRGSSERDWHSHGEDVPDARNIWMAFVSPDWKRRGEWTKTPTVYQDQIAATLTKALGFDYSEQDGEAGKPIELLFKK